MNGLLAALRALASFDPPSELPPCDLDQLVEVVDAHGLAPLASYHLENRRIGAAVPEALRERLLPVYQGVVSDNVFKLVTLKGALRGSDVPVVLLGGAAYVDWLYPHLAFRPIGDPRLLVRGADGAAFAAAVAPEFKPERNEGAVAAFTNGQFELLLQEGIVRGRAEDHGLFERREPFPAMGRAVARPALEDALLATVADLAEAGLYAALLEYVDLRELALRVEPAVARVVRERAERAGLSRALHGALAVMERYFPDASAAAAALRPELGRAERAAVDAVVAEACDPTKLRVLRGAVGAARAVVMPR